MNNEPKWTKSILIAVVLALLATAVVPSEHMQPLNAATAASSSADPIASGHWQFDRYDPIIVSEADAHGLDPFIVKGQILLESYFNPNAISPWGDLGLMQLKAATFKALGYTGSWCGMFDPWTNIYYGTLDMQHLLWQFGNIDLALQAYNIGSQSVANGARNWAYSNWAEHYAQMFRDEHASLYGSGGGGSSSSSSSSQGSSGSSSSQSSGSTSSTSTRANANNNMQYTVRLGDYLYEIGQTYGASWQNIAQINNIRYPYLIYPGEILRFHEPKYTVTSGDTMYSIAQKFHVSWQSLAHSNRIAAPYVLQPGEQLVIP
jgi:LysM repeat protein